MKISIKHLSTLSNVKLSFSEEETMQSSISSVVEHMKEIKNLDLENIEETNGVSDEENVWREDIVTPSFSQSEALKNSKNTHNGFFVVPYVFKKENKDAA